MDPRRSRRAAGRRAHAACWPTALLLLLAGSVAAQSGLTTITSVSSEGFQGSQASHLADVSGDGRWVAFTSASENLVPGDSNGSEDVFLHDRLSGVTSAVSVSPAGVFGNGRSRYPSLSGDGSLVAFASLADNLVPGGTGPNVHIYVYDRRTAALERVSVSSAGVPGDSWSTQPALTNDGRLVCFWGEATNLVPGDLNGQADVFLHDRQLGTTELVSLAWDGRQGSGASSLARPSADGRFVVYISQAEDLVPDDTNASIDVFLRDRQAGRTERVSVSSSGGQAHGDCDDPALSADGRFVVFASAAPDLVPGDTNGAADVFLRDRQVGSTRRVSVGPNGVQANGSSGQPDLSDDGRWIVFSSHASNLVPGDVNGVADVFRYDRLSGGLQLVSQSSQGTKADADSFEPRVSAAGTVLSFATEAANLVYGDGNHRQDICVRDLSTCPLPGRYCAPKISSLGCGPGLAWSGSPTLSGPDDFHLLVADVPSQQAGVLLLGTQGQALPLGGGLLCVEVRQRLVAPTSSGNLPPGSDCSGSFDFHVAQAAFGQLGLSTGQLGVAQVWTRDTGFAPPDNVLLSAALQFALCP